jgi:hypothetical protein
MWVKVHISGGKHFYLHLPISYYAFEELFDCVMDLLSVACFFTPKRQLTDSSSVSICTMKSLMEVLINLMDSLFGSESCDLVNVEVENVKVSVKIR